jgi:hypothetical protein
MMFVDAVRKILADTYPGSPSMTAGYHNASAIPFQLQHVVD